MNRQIEYFCFWQTLGRYDHEVEATYVGGRYHSMRYTGRVRATCHL